ncbi:MAG: helix-turn-helix domain-containing protein [Solirubrobacteraceae bacterium]
MSLLLLVNGDLAGHLRDAVSRHRLVLDHLGRACPPELEQVEQSLAEIARGGHGQSGVVTPLRRANVTAMNREWLSVGELVEVTGLSESTIRRALRKGLLPSTRVGRVLRVHRDSLAAYMDGRAA